MHAIILGGGISGLTAAVAVHKLPGATYCVYERRTQIGGLCRTRTRDGFTFDDVSHVLHFRTEEGRRLVKELLGPGLRTIERSAWIYYQDNYLPYPFQTHLGYLPFQERLECLVGFLRVWWKRKLHITPEPRHFGEWIHQFFGSGIARLFMVPYNTKLWGIPPEEMSIDWIRPFVPSTSLRKVVQAMLLGPEPNIGFNSWFHYPAEGGMQTLIDALAHRIDPVRLGEAAVSVDLDRKRVSFASGREVSYDVLISTVPLRELVLTAQGMPERLRNAARGLRCTSMLNLTFCLRRSLPHDFHWVYFPEPEFPFFRLVFPSNISLSLAPANGGIIAAELSELKPGQADGAERAVNQKLIQLGFIQDPSDVVFVERSHLKHAYPVHDVTRAEVVEELLAFLRSKEVWSIGRFGAWRYSSIDDAIAEAVRAVRQLQGTCSEVPVVSS